MEEAEFDKFAEEYDRAHRQNIRLSGEDPTFFARYKVQDLKKIAHAYALPRDPAILDFGCGVGTSLAHMREAFTDSRIVGADVSRKSLAIARRHADGQTSLTSFDGTTLPFRDGSFDIAFAACVFHHIAHDEHSQLLRELRRVLDPHGVMVIFEHNPFNPLTVHAVNTCEFDENAVLLRGRRLRVALAEAGFSDSRIAYRIFFPGILSGLRPLERFLAWLPLGAQYYVAARR